MVKDTYKATIGLEVHAELKTKSKMFCGCKNEPHNSEPNTNICPVCTGHPGTLPVPNEEAIAKVLLFGKAVESNLASYSEFDRKNYFYPDIPKAYQISQYAFPFLTGGFVEGVELTRVHLEEDTARSQHESDGVSLVDFNRAGVPLMELVTEPVIHDAKTAGTFARELQLLLKTLEISDAQMERGEMRVEANISVSKSSELGTKVEVKNLNSFKSVEASIEYEIRRQIETLERGEEVIQETRGWDEVKLKTYTQRRKETAKDYRYFPDPDISKIDLAEYPRFIKSRQDDILPTLPQEKRLKYREIGLTETQIETLLQTKSLDKIFIDIVLNLSNDKSNQNILRLSANYLTSDVLAEMKDSEEKIVFTTENFTKLMMMLDQEKINSRVAKDLIKEMIGLDFDPEVEVKKRGLTQSSDSDTIKPIIDSIIEENSSVVVEYVKGKESALQFLVGQGMKKTKGSANPSTLASMLRDTISKL